MSGFPARGKPLREPLFRARSTRQARSFRSELKWWRALKSDTVKGFAFSRRGRCLIRAIDCPLPPKPPRGLYNLYCSVKVARMKRACAGAFPRIYVGDIGREAQPIYRINARALAFPHFPLYRLIKPEPSVACARLDKPMLSECRKRQIKIKRSVYNDKKTSKNLCSNQRSFRGSR